MKKNLFKTNIREICEIAIVSALAIVMDRFVRIPVGATGGSINICSIPLFIIAYRHGWFKGFIASGIVFGLITCLFDGYGMQFFPLEYLVAFGSIGIGGLFGKKINDLINTKGTSSKVIAGLMVVATVSIFFVIRLFAATLDSMIFYEYPFKAALIYNISYIGPSAGALAIFLIMLLPLIKILNKMFKTEYLSESYDEE